MKSQIKQRNAEWTAVQLAPGAIGLGLVMLAGAIVWRLPAISGVALVSLGATLLTLERFRFAPSLPLILFAHCTVYGSLYLLFLAATFPGLKGDDSDALIPLVDLAASLAIMAWVIGRMAAACWWIARSDS